MRLIMIMLATCLANFIVLAQNFQNIYDSGFGYNDSGENIVLAHDGFLLKSSTLCYTPSGNIYFCSPLFKTGYDGTLDWLNIYDDYPNGLGIYDMIEANDGHIIVGTNALIDGYEPFAMKININGDSIWFKYLSGTERRYLIFIADGPDSNYLAVGQGKMAENLTHVYLLKIDGNGNELWSKNIETGYPQNLPGNFAILPNGDMVFGIDASLVGDLDDHATVVLTDSLGNTKWAKSYYTLDFDRCDNAFVQPLPNGGFVLQYCLDTISQVYNAPTKLWGLDSLGEVTWTLTFPFDAHRTFRTMSASNGDVVGCGRMYVQLPGDPQGDYLGWLWRVSPQGQLLWQRAYKPTYHTGGIAWLVDLVEAPDGGIAAIGITEDTLAGPGGTDVWLVKVGPDGCFTPGCTEEVIISDVKEENGALVSESEARPRVFPNPATSQVAVALPAPLPQPATWQLHDALGREVAWATLPAGQREMEVGLPHLPPGVYFWQVGNGEGLLGSGKLIIAK